MRIVHSISLALLGVGLLLRVAGAQDALPVHDEHTKLLDGIKLHAERAKEPAAAPLPEVPRRLATPAINTTDFVVLGYVQNASVAHQYHWHALTHVACQFTRFNADGTIGNAASFTGRTAELRAGGDAEANGVKVLMALANLNSGGDFDSSILSTVMQNDTLRQTLADNVAALVNADGYCAGVNLDFEPFPTSYPSATAAGTADFINKLRAALNADKEISIYCGPTYYGTWGQVIAGAIDSLDYMNYSCYPFVGSWSSSIIGVAPQSSYASRADDFLANGCPPEKLVLTLPSYGYRARTDTPAYNVPIVDHIGSRGFCDSKWETTLSANLRDRQYRAGAETPWYSFDNGTNYTTTVYDDEISLATKMRAARSWIGAEYPGRRLRGVGFWSLMWMSANYSGGFYSFDMESGASADKNRTYPYIYQATQEVLAPPGTRTTLLDKWESQDFRWRSYTATNDRKDNVNVNHANTIRSIAATPAGTGKPDNSDRCMRLDFEFTAASGKLFFRYEILGHHSETTRRDLNATRGFFDLNSIVQVDLYTPAAYTGRTVRMVLMDKNGELEQSQAFSLNAAGWRTLQWNLRADPVSAYTTSFNQYVSGNGVLDTAGAGARDLALIGFLVEGGASSGSGTVYFDELRFAPRAPEGKNYTLNEFRYRGSADEFVEIYGPAGAFPAGMTLRLLPGDATTSTEISLAGQSIPNDAGGFGYFVVGDPGVPNVDFSTGFGDAADDLPDIAPSGLQLRDSATGYVYDSLVYLAFGGMGTLTRPHALGVTDNGYPWIGGLGSGGNAAGTVYTMGRYPDGANTFVNAADFSFQNASPGLANSTTLIWPVTYDFTTAPSVAFKTFQNFTVSSPPLPSPIPNSPGGGNVHRCVDTVGGGVMTVIGNAALGAGGVGCSASGEWYIPAASEPAQAIAVGFCASQGSTFFTGASTVANSGYESGYMIIYENKSGVGLNNGRADHPGAFEFLHATHDNLDGVPTALLADKTRAELEVTEGAWTRFYFSVDPAAPASRRLIAMLNNKIVYQGDIPAGGPTAGAFQAGFRENHTGAPASNEGCWIDTLRLEQPFQAVAITVHPLTQSVQKNDPVTLSVTATGTGFPTLTYQWKKNTIDLIGENGPTLFIPSAELLDAGDYTCEVGNIITSQLSNTATLTVTESKVKDWKGLSGK